MTKIPDFIIGMVFVSALLTVICTVFYKKFAPATKIRVLMSIPVAGTFFSIVKTRDFSSEIGELLQSGLSYAKRFGCIN